MDKWTANYAEPIGAVEIRPSDAPAKTSYIKGELVAVGLVLAVVIWNLFQ